LKKIFNLTIFAFIGPFIATFFVVLFVILIQFLWTYIDDLVGKGLEWYIILKLLFFASASFVPTALPLAILLSSIMAFGKLAETYELVALKSAGVSLVRVMVPMITIVSLIGIGDFFFSNNVIPVANLKFHSLLWDIRQQRPALDIKEGVFYGGIDYYSIRINKKDKNSQKIEGVTIYDHTHQIGNDVVMVAKSGEMSTTPNQRWLIIKLYDGTRYEEMRSSPTKGYNSYPADRVNFKSYEIKFDLSLFKLQKTKEELFKENSVMLNINQLQYYVDSLDKLKKKNISKGMEYTRPYLYAFRDTTVFKATAKIAPEVPSGYAGAPLIYTMPTENRKDILVRAANSARALKEIYQAQAQEIQNLEKERTKYDLEWHRKFSISLACLTLFFIGAPLGAIIRKGGIGYPTVVAIIMFIIYYVISIIGERAAKENAINVVIGMWISTIVLMPIGLYLTYRANRDSIGTNFIRSIKRFLRMVIRSRISENDEEMDKEINTI
jgi:lipopolysaccharide export system permease protein